MSVEHEVDPEAIIADLEDLLGELGDAALEIGSNEFFVSVRGQAQDMLASMKAGGRGTSRRYETVTNWRKGVAKWTQGP